ncbi:flagellar biosynthesis/type III secretory pathway lipoprotein [Singulisphaera sp. PoT]|uniref:flagellar biosynthesis/type III secretory pathway lipoprotein n=1 Tax=Singulisphaera sp. PoT TaxID=3411797 RepID=UPI003BF4E426
MRTEKVISPATIAARLRTQGGRIRRAVLAQSVFVRWLAVGVAVALIIAIGYVATIPTPGTFLQNGKQYAADDIAKITRALDAQSIAYRVEEGRIGVASDRLTETMAIVAKLGVDPRPIPEIRDESLKSGFFDSASEIERRASLAEEQTLETMIRNLDGIVSAYVKISRSRTRVMGRSATAATAFVQVETDGNHELNPKTVEAIKGLVLAYEHDVKAEGLSLYDRKGRPYLHAGNPTAGAITRTRAREEELSQAVYEELEWIKGVRVTVQLVPAPPPAPIPTPVAVIEEPPPAETTISVNQGMDLTAEVKPATPPPPLPPPKPAVEVLQAHIWVRVPTSYYYKICPVRNPSNEDLQPLVAKAEGLIRTAVKLVVPPDEAGEVMIDTIPDNVSSKTALEAPSVPENRSTPSWWIPAGVGGAVVAMLLIAGVRVFATRRPARSATPPNDRGRYSREDPAETRPAPTERVRELIRRDPEAAASVLNRWIGQGGHAE